MCYPLPPLPLVCEPALLPSFGQVCVAAIAAVGDVGRAVGKDFLKYSDLYVTTVFHNLQVRGIRICVSLCVCVCLCVCP